MLTALQTRIQTLLIAHTWFQDDGVEIITEETGDFVNRLDRVVGELKGLAVLVMTPAGQPEGQPGTFKVNLRMEPMVWLAELYNFNRTGKRARDGVVPCIQALQGQWCGVGNENAGRGNSNIFACQGFAQQGDDDGALAIYQVRFGCAINLSAGQLPAS
mgnify:FL=1